MSDHRYLWVDPPAGWAYGFPRVWDTQEYKTVHEFFEAYGYKDEGLPYRMWAATEEEYNENV